MPKQHIKSIIITLIIVFAAIACGLPLYATGIDTFNIRQYRIKKHQLEQCLSKIAKEESNKHYGQIGFVVTCIRQDDDECLLVGCHTLAWLKFYSMLYEVRDNEFVGCSYLKNGVCFLFGNEIKQYLSDSIGTVCFVDSNNYFKPLLGNEADFKEWFDGYCQGDLYVDPPIWILKKQKNKFVRISGSEFHYTPKRNRHHIQAEKTRITFYQMENPYYKAIHEEYYRVLKHYHLYHNVGNRPWKFYAFDLTDTTNVLVEESDTLFIFDNHIYYIVTPSLYEKVSIMAIPVNETMYFFSGLNCCKPIHRVSDVLEWLSTQNNCTDKFLLERVGNCLSYYQAIPIDPQGSVPYCECSCKSSRSNQDNTYKKPKQKKILSHTK